MFINDSCVYQRQLHQPVFINDSYISLCLSTTTISACVYQWQLHQPVFINDIYISLFINDVASACLCLSMTSTPACVSCHRCSGFDYNHVWFLGQICVVWRMYVVTRHLFCFVRLCCEKWWWCVSCLFSKMSLFWLVLTDIWSYGRNVLCDRCTHAVAVAFLTVADVIPTALAPQRHHTTMRNFKPFNNCIAPSITRKRRPFHTHDLTKMHHDIWQQQHSNTLKMRWPSHPG